MKTKNIKKILFVFLVASFFILVIIPGTRAIFLEKESTKINLNVESPSFIVTFNPNGGSATFESKDVQYNKQYGELPDGYKCGTTFLGWYTGLDSGAKIESTDIFNIMDEQTLYARYSDNNELYDTLKCEEERTDILNANRLAKKYTGSHNDSFVEEATKDVIFWYGSDTVNADLVNNSNNVLFANYCWKMIRTTDTGGVKLVYNGEPDDEGQCGDDRDNHIGYDSLISTKLSASSSGYYYGTDYNYNSDTQEFSLSGDIQQKVWNEENSALLIGKYTCKSEQMDGTCSILYLVESYKNSYNDANVIKIISDAYYSAIGKLQYNKNKDSLSYVGYMYNSVYETLSIYYDKQESLYKTIPLSDKIWYSDSYDWNTIRPNYYTLLDQKVQTDEQSYSDLIGKYTFGSSTGLEATGFVYYIVGATDSSILVIELEEGVLLEDANSVYTIGDSYSPNLDGTYSIDGGHDVTRLNWINTDYNSYLYKYICKNAVDGKCDRVMAVLQVSNKNFLYEYVDSMKTYASGYRYEEGMYYLNDDQITDRDIFTSNRALLNNHRYTCLNDTGECDKIAYVFYSLDTYSDYILLENNESITTAMNNMLYDDEVNKTNSTIKTGVDAWSKKYLDDYSVYLEDIIFCSNRALSDTRPGWFDTENVKKDINFKSSSIACENVTDQFSYANEKAHLDYKVGLLGYGEVNETGNSNVTKSGISYWLMSPQSYSHHGAYPRNVAAGGGVYNLLNVEYSLGVRPVISLKPGTKFSSGTGKKNDPYIVDEVVYPEGKDKTTVEVGDIVKIGTEEFYVVKEAETENGDLVLLARYNLNVGNNKKADATEGIQDSEVKGFVTSGTVYGNVPFSSTGYWNGLVGTSYSGTYCQNDTFTSSSNCAYVYDSNSSIKPYLDSYKNYLKGEGTTIKDIRLLSAEEVYELGCGHGEWSCVDSPSNAPSWVYETSYWLGSATDDNLLMNVWSEGTFADESCNTGVDFGVRPVIVI